MNRSTNPYERHRFPPAIIRWAVWLYHRFNLSHRDIDDLLAERGTEASYESARLWCNKLRAHAVVYDVFNLQRHPAPAAFYRFRRARAFKCWNEAVAA